MSSNEDDDFDVLAHGWPINPPIDRAIVEQAKQYLAEYSETEIAELLNRCDENFEKFAEQIAWTREIHRFGSVCLRPRWRRNDPPHVGALLTDLDMLPDILSGSTTFREFVHTIDEDSLLAELAVVSLLVRRAVEWNDTLSVNGARTYFDLRSSEIINAARRKRRADVANRHIGAEGGRAKARKLDVRKSAVTNIARRIRAANTLITPAALTTSVYSHLPAESDGKKPTKRTIRMWLRAAGLLPAAKPRKKRES